MIDYDHEIQELRNKLALKEDAIQEIDEKGNNNYREVFALRDTERNLNIEINQLKKIIYTNEKMSLFSFNTCPWCLKELPDKANETKCYCGNSIEDDEKIVFEYNTEEYKTILKSKNKTLATIIDAISDMESENEQLKEDKNKIKIETNKIKYNINEYVKNYNSQINFQKLDQIDREIKNNRHNIYELEEYIKTESKLEDLRTAYNTADENYKEKKINKEILEKEAQNDIFKKIKVFNEKFKELMTNSLEDCKTASIDIDNYMPIIDDGYYREKSASVHVRLMFFYTLLYMSLRYKRIKFPHFLLIDTPDTNGIDPESLKRAIRQIENIKIENEEYQVILTTMEYPEEFEEYTKGDILIKKENYLLRRHEKSNK